MKTLLRKISLYAAVFLILIGKIHTQIFAADVGCSSGYPSCILDPGTNWDCQTVSSCNTVSNPGDVIQLTSKTCCKPKAVDTTKDCGTASNSSGPLTCKTPGGNIAIGDGSAWSWCGQALVGNPCCSNANNQGGTRCQQLTLTAATTDANAKPFNLCDQVADPTAKGLCQSCATNKGVWTAVGCVDSSKDGIASAAIKLGLGIGGGVVLLMILAAAFKLTTSKGDPKATQEAQEMITNAIGGLLFIIFSVVLVRTVGKTLLQIPGF